MWICKHCEYTHWDFTPSQLPLPEATLPKLGATRRVSNFGPFSAKSILMPVVLIIHSLDCAKEPEKNNDLFYYSNLYNYVNTFII